MSKSRRNIVDDDDYYYDGDGDDAYDEYDGGGSGRTGAHDGDDAAEESYPDSEILNTVYDAVADIVGEQFTEAQIVGALRRCDYDVARSVGTLLDGQVATKATVKTTPAKGKNMAVGGHVSRSAHKEGVASPKPTAVRPAGTAVKNVTAEAGRTARDTPGHAQVSATLPVVPPEVEASAAHDAPRVSVVCCGHVDAGKSTLLGHLLCDLGVVSQKTLTKFAREARAAGKASFAYAWVMDEEESERSRGITVDIGVNSFVSRAPRQTGTCAGGTFTLLDAPGHRDYIPTTIAAAMQADLGILVVDATVGELETGLSPGGQTREHISLLAAAGVPSIIVAVNKMDAPTVNWAVGRFAAARAALIPVLSKAGYSKSDVTFVPVSGLRGINLVTPPAEMKLVSSSASGVAAKGSGRSAATSTPSQSEAPRMPPTRPSTADSLETDEAAVRRARDAARDMGLGDLLPDSPGIGPGGADAGDTPSRERSSGVATPTPSTHRASSSRPAVTAAADGLLLPEATAEDVTALLAWYPASAPTLLSALEAARAPVARTVMLHRPLRIAVYDVYSTAQGGQGLTVAGRVEAGFVMPHTRLSIAPGGASATARSVWRSGSPATPAAVPGDMVDVGVGGVELEALCPGQVIGWVESPPPLALKFKAELLTLDGLSSVTGVPLLPGTAFMLYAGSSCVPCNVTRLLRTLDRPGGHTVAVKPRLVGAAGVAVVVRIRLTKAVPLGGVDRGTTATRDGDSSAPEVRSAIARLGRFILRYGDRSVAAGRVLKVSR